MSTAAMNAAVSYTARGWRVVPLHGVGPDGLTCSCKHGRRCTSKGKHPIEKAWTEAEPDLASIARMYPRWNVGLATGQVSGFFVLDVDDMDALKALVEQHGKLPRTYTVRTGGKGLHIYFAMPVDLEITNSSGSLPKGIDVRGTGGQVVAPPSTTDKGGYTVLHDEPLAEAPDWLLEQVAHKPSGEPQASAPATYNGPGYADLPAAEQARLLAYADRAMQRELDWLRKCSTLAKDGSHGYDGPPWNQTTYTTACALLDLAESPWSPLTVDKAEQLVRENAPHDAGFTADHVEKCLWSAHRRSSAGQGRPLPPTPDPDPDFMSGPEVRQAVTASDDSPVAVIMDETHTGQVRLAYRYAAKFNQKFMHVNGIGWHAWDGSRWIDDEIDASYAAVLEVLRDALADSLGDKQLRADVRRSETASGVAGILRIASTLPGIAYTAQQLDNDPYLLNVANGTLDLRTTELRSFAPEDRITKICRGAYHPGERSGLWAAFLERVVPDVQTRAFLQRLAGVALLGIVREHVLGILYGETQNGKGTFYGAMSNALGDYAGTAEPDLFMHREGAHPTGEMDLRGKRWIVVSEIEKGRKIAEATMKRLTGGDLIHARRMRQDFVSFAPSHTPILVTNDLPAVRGDDPAIWRRIRVIPFNVHIPDSEKDPKLGEKMQLAADAIVTWAVEGYLEYVAQNGLNEPSTVLVATAKYQKENDDVAEFIEQRCMVSEHATIPMGDLYAAWQKWASTGGIEPISQKAFGKELDRRGFPPVRTMHARLRKGLSLYTESDETFF